MCSAASNSGAVPYAAPGGAGGVARGAPARAAAALRAAWAAPGTWALADQAVLSLGNFLTQLVLARNLPADDYGTFVLVYMVLLFLNTLHNAVVVYPLSVRGAVAAAGPDLRRLAGAALAFTAILAPAMGLLLAGGATGAAAARRHQGLPVTSLFPWALGAMVLWQSQETLRRAIMARLQYRRALPGDAIGYLGQAAVLLVLVAAGGLSLRTAFAAVAVTSAAAAVVQFVQVWPGSPAGRDHLIHLARDFWRLGRWVLPTCGLTLITAYAMPWMLTFAHGPAELATYQALANVLAVGNPIVMGINNVVVPAVAQASAAGGGGLLAARRITIRYGLLGAALLAPLYAALALAPRAILTAVYGVRSPYAGLALPMRLFVVAYAMYFPAQVMTFLLYGLGRTRRAFLAQGAFAAATLLVSLPAAARYGLWGAVWAGLLPPAVYVAVTTCFVRRLRRGAGGGGGGAPDEPAPWGAADGGRLP